jgi:hypothetical protein
MGRPVGRSSGRRALSTYIHLLDDGIGGADSSISASATAAGPAKDSAEKAT